MTEGIIDPTPSAPPCGLEDTSRMKRSLLPLTLDFTM